MSETEIKTIHPEVMYAERSSADEPEKVCRSFIFPLPFYIFLGLPTSFRRSYPHFQSCPNVRARNETFWDTLRMEGFPILTCR